MQILWLLVFCFHSECVDYLPDTVTFSQDLGLFQHEEKSVFYNGSYRYSVLDRVFPHGANVSDSNASKINW